MYKTRCFSRFEARIFLTEKVGNDIRESETYTEFIAPFCQRSLECCCQVHRFLPRKFCSARIVFSLLEPSVDIHKLDFDTNMFYTVHNYEQVRERIVRTIIFLLTLNHYSQL